MRTGLSALPVPDLVRELVIAHTKPGLHKVYDQHSHVDEKRQALGAWSRRVLLVADASLLGSVEDYLGVDSEDERNKRRHAYNEAIMAGSERWAAWLKSIVEPPPSNVVKLDQARA